MEHLKTIFWVCGALIIYPYIVFPAFLGVLSVFARRKPGNRIAVHASGTSESHHLPTVTILISVYNEEKVIDEKIRNTLELEYPSSLLEIIVISDGSTDQTGEIVTRYSGQGVRLMEYPGRIGKTACLNLTVPEAKGEIVIFSDANSIYEKNAVMNIVSCFSDPSIGFVTGYTKYRRGGTNDTVRSIGLYSRIEKLTKMLESRVSSCVGADGAIFGIRRNLYTPLKDYDINDLVIPLSIVRRKYRGILSDQAYCTENSAGDIRGEYQRQIRITNRALRAIFNNADLFNPWKSGIFSFFLLSHKLMKYLAPFFLLALFLTSVGLVRSGYVYVLAVVAQCAFFAIGLESTRRGHARYSLRILEIVGDFMVINIAVLRGWLKYFSNEKFTTWSPTRR